MEKPTIFPKKKPGRKSKIELDALDALPFTLEELGQEAHRRFTARGQLLPFIRYLMPSYQIKPHHRLIAQKLEAVERGEIRRLMVCVGPRSGKSLLVSEFFPAWFFGRNPKLDVMESSYGADLAVSFGRKVRNLLLEPKYQNIFPEVTVAKDSQAQDEWHTNQGGGYKAEGVGGGITGYGAHLGIIDDPFKGWEDASSPQRRKLVWSWYTSEFYTRLMPYKGGEGSIVLVNTRWADNDLGGMILEQMKDAGQDQWEVISLPSLAEENDPLGRQVGEALWEERFPRVVLEKYRQLEPKKFMSLHQQKPVPDEGFYFKLDWLKYYSQCPKYLRIYAASDYATKNKAGDYTVHLIIGIDPDDDIYLLDLWRKQADSQTWVEQAIDWMAKYHPVKWAEERGQIIGGVGPFLAKRMQERKIFCVREQFFSSKDKQTRAQSFAGRMQQGKIYMPTYAPWRAEFEWEFSRFPDGVFDDQVDACSLIGKMLDTMGHGRLPKQEPKLEPLKPVGYTFHQLMGMAKAHRQGRSVRMQGVVVPYKPTVEEWDDLAKINMVN